MTVCLAIEPDGRAHRTVSICHSSDAPPCKIIGKHHALERMIDVLDKRKNISAKSKDGEGRPALFILATSLIPLSGGLQEPEHHSPGLFKILWRHANNRFRVTPDRVLMGSHDEIPNPEIGQHDTTLLSSEYKFFEVPEKYEDTEWGQKIIRARERHRKRVPKHTS